MNLTSSNNYETNNPIYCNNVSLHCAYVYPVLIWARWCAFSTASYLVTLVHRQHRIQLRTLLSREVNKYLRTSYHTLKRTIEVEQTACIEHALKIEKRLSTSEIIESNLSWNFCEPVSNIVYNETPEVCLCFQDITPVLSLLLVLMF